MKRLFKGFTLAEVLITIAILGVVAAIVLPTVLNNIDDRVLETQNKKAKAVFANGIKMLTAQSGSPYLKDTQLKRCRADAECIATEIKKAFKVVDDSISSPKTFGIGYLENDESENEIYPWEEDAVNYAFLTADGSMFGILFNDEDRNSLSIFFDANGEKTPNTAGRDLCLLTLDETAQLVGSDVTCPFDVQMEQAADCSTSNPSACTQAQCLSLPGRASMTMDCHYVWSGSGCREQCSYSLSPTPIETLDDK